MVDLADAVAGDICLWDGTKKLFGRFVDSGANEAITNYTPIGIVVIPASHNVYGNGSCGVMSLKEMSCDTPDDGGIISYRYVYWGGYGVNLTNASSPQSPYVGTGSNVGNSSSTIVGEYLYAYLPSDRFSAVQCPHDTDTYYYSSSSSNRQAPSPYFTNGSRNPAYYQTSPPSSENNAFADFNGIENSILLWNSSTAQSDWRTSSTITNSSDAGYYPAACCCWRYHTEGTQQGDWYLPACGELGYIMSCFNKIDNTIINVLSSYDSSIGVRLQTSSSDGNYWTSTETSSLGAIAISTHEGSNFSNNKGGPYRYARAFLRVSPSDV